MAPQSNLYHPRNLIEWFFAYSKAYLYFVTIHPLIFADKQPNNQKYCLAASGISATKWQESGIGSFLLPIKPFNAYLLKICEPFPFSLYFPSPALSHTESFLTFFHYRIFILFMEKELSWLYFTSLPNLLPTVASCFNTDGKKGHRNTVYIIAVVSVYLGERKGQSTYWVLFFSVFFFFCIDCVRHADLSVSVSIKKYFIYLFIYLLVDICINSTSLFI